MILSNVNLIKYPDLEILITPIKGCSQLRIKQLLTIYQGVHITYFKCVFCFDVINILMFLLTILLTHMIIVFYNGEWTGDTDTTLECIFL